MAGLPRRDQATAKSSAVGLPDVRMPLATARLGGGTLSNDIIMDTSRSGTTLKNGNLQLWERELLESSEVRRKSTVAQLCTSRYTLSYSISPDLRL
jgi:cell cycle protein kinase DBF2